MINVTAITHADERRVYAYTGAEYSSCRFQNEDAR